jgi:putative ABC transport system ATP-binding protein
VIGPSGTGKTTLLHLLAGLELPSAGSVAVDGAEVSSLDRSARAVFRRDRVALVGQEPGLVPFLTARENVELGLTLRGVASVETETRSRDALAAVGLAARAEARVDHLSSGERERVAVARAVAARPTLLLADEPTARLDRQTAVAIGRLLRDVARSGAAVVCATHDPILIELADDVVALDTAPK